MNIQNFYSKFIIEPLEKEIKKNRNNKIMKKKLQKLLIHYYKEFYKISNT